MNTYTKKITPIEADKIKNIFQSLNADFDNADYTLWRAKTKNFQAVYYNSGKLLIQGREISDIVKMIDEKAVINNSEPSKEASIIIEYDKYIGTDESGKGDFFGPLVAAGVQVNDENKQKFIDIGIKDSKKLDDAKILELAGKIKANAVHSVVVITPVKYNELYKKFNNLNKLLAWAHARAIENILEKSPCGCALADKFGDEGLIKNALMNKGREIELKQEVRAEANIAVAAASVLARAEFVKRISDMEKRYNIKFPKGASSLVIESAKQFIGEYSFDRLKEVAKMHFKTVNELK